MKKSHIVSNIQKYFLGGLSKGVIWNIQNNQAVIEFTTETKDTVGKLFFLQAQKLRAFKNHLFLDYTQFIMVIWNQYMLQKMAIFLFMVISIK